MILMDNRTTRRQNKLKNDDVNDLIRLVLQEGHTRTAAGAFRRLGSAAPIQAFP